MGGGGGENGAINPIRIVLLLFKTFVDYLNCASMIAIVYNVSFCFKAFALIVS